MSFAVIDVQGFRQGVDGFIPKELAITKDGVNVHEYLFSCLTPYQILSSDEKRQVNYLQKNHHGIRYSTPGLPPCECYKIITNFLTNNKISEVYVKGDVKKRFLEKLISIPCINIEYESECPKFAKSAPHCNLGCHTMSSNVVCAYKNCVELYNWLYKFY